MSQTCFYNIAWSFFSVKSQLHCNSLIGTKMIRKLYLNRRKDFEKKYIQKWFLMLTFLLFQLLNTSHFACVQFFLFLLSHVFPGLLDPPHYLCGRIAPFFCHIRKVAVHVIMIRNFRVFWQVVYRVRNRLRV